MIRLIGIVISTSLALGVCVDAHAACDDLVGNLILAKLRPAVEGLDCSVVKKLGMDKKDHKLASVCYRSNGAISGITIDARLRCYGSDKAVFTRAMGKDNAPSVSENVIIDAEARGSDCMVTALNVRPSGDLGKALVRLFDANGKARIALQKALDQACRG